jgi:hypothetical protein
MNKVLIIVGILLLSSCASTKKTDCDAYGKSNETELKSNKTK